MKGNSQTLRAIFLPPISSLPVTDTSANAIGSPFGISLFFIKSNGIKRKLMGVHIETNEISLTGSVNITNNDGNLIGDLRSACYSPHFKKVIGIAMINEPFCKMSVTGKVEISGKNVVLKVCELPFI